MIDPDDAKLFGRSECCQNEARIVGLVVVVFDERLRALGPEAGCKRYGLVGRKATRAAILEAGKRRVDEYAGAELGGAVRRLRPHGKDETQWPHQMRCDKARIPATFAMRLAHETDVAETQVAEAAVNELR